MITNFARRPIVFLIHNKPYKSKWVHYENTHHTAKLAFPCNGAPDTQVTLQKPMFSPLLF